MNRSNRPEVFCKNCNFIKKEALVQVFSCEFCEICKNNFFYRTCPVACFWMNEWMNSQFLLLLVISSDQQYMLLTIYSSFTEKHVSKGNFFLSRSGKYLILLAKQLFTRYFRFCSKIWFDLIWSLFEEFVFVWMGDYSQLHMQT